jgi:hypothetical protein
MTRSVNIPLWISLALQPSGVRVTSLILKLSTTVLNVIAHIQHLDRTLKPRRKVIALTVLLDSSALKLQLHLIDALKVIIVLSRLNSPSPVLQVLMDLEKVSLSHQTVHHAMEVVIVRPGVSLMSKVVVINVSTVSKTQMLPTLEQSSSE